MYSGNGTVRSARPPTCQSSAQPTELIGLSPISWAVVVGLSGLGLHRDTGEALGLSQEILWEVLREYGVRRSLLKAIHISVHLK